MFFFNKVCVENAQTDIYNFDTTGVYSVDYGRLTLVYVGSNKVLADVPGGFSHW